MKKSRQQVLDEEYCKFGYTYNRMTDECEPVAAYGEGSDTPETPETPETPAPPVEEEPAAKKAKGKAVALKDAYVKGIADAIVASK